MLEKEKALEIALSQIEKSFGKGAIMKLGDASRVPVSVIPPAVWIWTLRSASAAYRADA